MKDFLTFQTFITQDVLIFFYYIGAVVMPLALWRFRRYMIAKLPFCRQADNMAKTVFMQLKPLHRWAAVAIFIVLFLVMELLWRMMFETMIAYFQIHDDIHRMLGQRM